jgi:hypothetical protein
MNRVSALFMYDAEDKFKWLGTEVALEYSSPGHRTHTCRSVSATLPSSAVSQALRDF